MYGLTLFTLEVFLLIISRKLSGWKPRSESSLILKISILKMLLTSLLCMLFGRIILMQQYEMAI